MSLPFASIEQLEEELSRPDDAVVSALASLTGDVVVAGAGGKMGPSLCRMASRALAESGSSSRVIAVSRFRNARTRSMLEESGLECRAIDLLDRKQVNGLPDAELVVSMVGFKFGAAQHPGTTWATNVLMPALLCERYPEAKFIAFSSGNVYGMVPVESGGSTPDDKPYPDGEYAYTVLGRERVYEYFGQTRGIESVLLRLNYAVEMRYGVLVDIARHVWNRRPVDVTMGYVNVIWQADANRMALRSLALASGEAPKLNIAGLEILAVRDVAARFAELWDVDVAFTGSEQPDAFLNNATASYPLLGPTTVSAEQLIEWTADWIQRDLPQWDLPTHFQNRGGDF